jgi:beta-phosphoglucomutase
MIQAVIFDFDGVLFDSSRLHFEATRTVLAERGIELSPQTYRQEYFGVHDVAMLQMILPREQADPQTIRALIQRKIELYLKQVHHQTSLPAIEGVGNFLAALSAHTPHLAIFSNGNLIEVGQTLAKLDGGTIAPYFKHVTTIDEVTEGKPHPEGYLLSAKKLGIDPAHCLVIEDSMQGIRAAKAAKMRVIGLATTHDQNTLRPHVDYAAADYRDALKWLTDIEYK